MTNGAAVNGTFRAVLVLVIHCGCALSANRARHWLRSARASTLAHRVASTALVVFGLSLAMAQR
jgi:threonine/homoserine/homoserine lactone efflux protein